MSNKMTSNVITNLSTKEKLGYAMKKIINLLKIVTIALYIILNIKLVYDVFHLFKYPYAPLNEQLVKLIGIIGLFTILLPGVLIAVLFLKKDNIVIKVVKSVIQIGVLVALPYLYIIGYMGITTFSSYTVNPNNYEGRDQEVSTLLKEPEFSMLPKELPDNIVDEEYFYHYESRIFDRSYLTLDVAWTYEDEEQYEKLKSEMTTYSSANDQFLLDGFHMKYAIGNKEEDEKHFSFGYNDDEKRVTYRIYYVW